MRIFGKIENGKLDINFNKIVEFAKTLPDCRVELKLGQIKSKRSINQNQYYWGIVVKLLSDHTGYSAEEMHEILKYKFIEAKKIVLKEEEIEYRPSTTKFNTTQFENYLTEVRQWATDLGVYIPMPNEDRNE